MSLVRLVSRAGCALVMLILSLAVAADGPADSPQLVAPTEAISAAEQQKMFHLPPGFEIQLVAAEPEIRKPMNLNFDVHGRLYATQSTEYPFPAEGEAPRRDVIKRFDDIGPDGKPSKVVTVVEGLNIPIGLLPREDGLIYYSIPDIFRATDEDGDGLYEKSNLLFGKFGFRDTHGMASSFTRWVDGWVYACHGYNNDSEIKGADDKAVKMNSGNTYRFRADGSHVEQFTHGQVNPFGLTMDPLGNLYSSDCHTKPIYMLLRGAWYPSFGKPHDGLGYGPEMIEHLHGSTGIAGVVYYDAHQFPPEYRDTVFIGNPVTGRVNRDRLEPHGSTYKAIELPDFISCDDGWFRPVDLKLGPDGALYIADFYNCIIGHYEVPLKHPRRDRSYGRIWRVVYTGKGVGVPQKEEGAAKPDPALALTPMPNLTKVNVSELVDLIGHPNMAVRVLASEQLTSPLTARAAVESIRAALAATGEEPATVLRRAHALWLAELGPKGKLTAEEIERLAADPSRLVRVHLVKALAERADWNGAAPNLYDLARQKLADPDAFVRRAAADSLGLHPSADNLAPLLKLWAEAPPDDLNLIHVARMALRDQLLQPGVYARAAELTAASPADGARLAEVSLGVRNADSAAFLLGYLKGNEIADDARLAEYLHDTARYVAEDRTAEVTALAQKFAQASPARQQAVLVALARAAQERGKPPADELTAWAGRLTDQLLGDSSAGEVQRGIDLARELKVAAAFDRLASLAAGEKKLDNLRPAAIDACVANDRARSTPLLAKVIGNSSEKMPIRLKGAQALAAMNIPESRLALAEELRVAPDKLAVEIARGFASTRDGTETLIAEVSAGKASPRLLTDTTTIQRIGSLKNSEIDKRVKELTADLPAEDPRLQELVAARRAGYGKAEHDVEAGGKVFAKTCGVCHKLAGQGAKIGPDLDGVGLRGLDRLLEDTLDPNRNVDEAFRTTVIATNSGTVITGLFLREEGAVLVLADNMGKEVRVPADEVDERSVQKLSPMPANVADQLPEGDYYNLLAYLLAQKQKVAKP
ncbi:MAG TPA: c-type cytochrome [Pirellulales bacterium]|jgi:putative heme-binding domain-containing protein